MWHSIDGHCRARLSTRTKHMGCEDVPCRLWGFWGGIIQVVWLLRHLLGLRLLMVVLLDINRRPNRWLNEFVAAIQPQPLAVAADGLPLITRRVAFLAGGANGTWSGIAVGDKVGYVADEAL